MMMMKIKKQPNSIPATDKRINNINKNININNNNTGPGAGAMEGLEWEMRPGGMLVQKRDIDLKHRNSTSNISTPTPTTTSTATNNIKLRVKFNSIYHEIQISPHASFGELKKMLSGPTGLQPQDQKLVYKDKERDSKQFLDIVGVKNGSRIYLTQDFIGRDKRLLELTRIKTPTTTTTTTADSDKAFNSVAEVTLEVDNLAAQVTKLEAVVTKGGIVSEKELLGLTELFMSQLIKLDGVVANGDAKLRRKQQVVRVQQYIETLDRLKAQNDIALQLQHRRQQRKKLSMVGVGQVQIVEQPNPTPTKTSFASQQIIVTSQWEKF